MMQLGGFITAAFLMTGTVFAGMIAAVLIDYRIQHRALRRLLLDHSDPRGHICKISASIHLPASATGPRRALARLWLTIPLLVFFGIAALLLMRLGAGDPSLVPSAVIGKPAPQFALEPLDGLSTAGPPGLSSADLRKGHVTIVNVFASWCVECQQEQRALIALARNPTLQQQGVKLTGIVYKDDPKNALAYLTTNGNPFAQVGTDRSGRTAIDFGVYGVPETYVVKGDGTIVYKLVGGISDASRPALMAAIAEAERP